jgi:hypothetical protein
MNYCARCFLLVSLWAAAALWPFLPAQAVPSFGLYDNATFSPTVTVERDSDSRIWLQLRMQNLPQTGTVTFASSLPGLWGEMNPTGQLLPRFSVFVALPPTGNPTATVEAWDTRPFTVAPSVSLPENNPQPSVVKLGSIGILGGARIVPVTFRPISYVNSANVCSVMYQAVVRIDLDQQTGENPLTIPRPSFSPAWRKVLEAVVVNWEDIPNVDVGCPSHILMVVPHYGSYDYIPLVQEYVRWKEQRGDRVTVVSATTDSLGGSLTALQLRQLVMDSLRASPPVDFVVLVGDETRIPVQTRNTSDPPSRFSTETYSGSYTDENYFAAVEGTDVFPDVFLGRWVVNLPQEVLTYVQRTVDHEKSPCVQDTMRFSRALMASDMQRLSQRQTKKSVRDMLLRCGFTTVDTVWGVSVSPWQITNRVNNGVTFLNYRGTGWGNGWAGVNFYDDNIADISNLHKLPIVTGIGCGVGIFIPSPMWSGTGFGETWMTAGSVTDPKGACGFIGPCWNTHTIFNDCLDSLLYRAWLDYGARHLMTGLVAGKMMVWSMMAQFLTEPAVAEVTQTMFRQYIVEGDPALQVYTAKPFALDVSLPAELPTEPGTISVTVNNALDSPADSLNVTLWRGPGDFETRWLSRGQAIAEFPFDPEQADTVVVTVTGDNVRAYQKRIPEQGSAVPRDVPTLPGRLELRQNYPNPFNSETVIGFALPKAAAVTLEVFDILGRRVAILADGHFAAGLHTVSWNGLQDDGRVAGSGVYFYRLTTPESVLARKMILLR